MSTQNLSIWLYLNQRCLPSCFVGILVKVKMLVTQLCLILCDFMDYNLPASSVCGILQERILEWVAIPYSRGSSQPKDQTWTSCIADRFFFTFWATRETLIMLGWALNPWWYVCKEKETENQRWRLRQKTSWRERQGLMWCSSWKLPGVKKRWGKILP